MKKLPLTVTTVIIIQWLWNAVFAGLLLYMGEGLTMSMAIVLVAALMANAVIAVVFQSNSSLLPLIWPIFADTQHYILEMIGDDDQEAREAVKGIFALTKRLLEVAEAHSSDNAA